MLPHRDGYPPSHNPRRPIRREAQPQTPRRGRRGLRRHPDPPQPRRSAGTASVVEDAAEVVGRVFDEADRRDPERKRRWVALVDGNRHQIDCIETQAKQQADEPVRPAQPVQVVRVDLKACDAAADTNWRPPDDDPRALPGSTWTTWRPSLRGRRATSYWARVHDLLWVSRHSGAGTHLAPTIDSHLQLAAQAGRCDVGLSWLERAAGLACAARDAPRTARILAAAVSWADRGLTELDPELGLLPELRAARFLHSIAIAADASPETDAVVRFASGQAQGAEESCGLGSSVGTTLRPAAQRTLRGSLTLDYDVRHGHLSLRVGDGAVVGGRELKGQGPPPREHGMALQVGDSRRVVEAHREGDTALGRPEVDVEVAPARTHLEPGHDVPDRHGGRQSVPGPGRQDGQGGGGGIRVGLRRATRDLGRRRWADRCLGSLRGADGGLGIGSFRGPFGRAPDREQDHGSRPPAPAGRPEC